MIVRASLNPIWNDSSEVLCRNDLAIARLNSWKRATKQACGSTQHHDLQCSQRAGSSSEVPNFGLVSVLLSIWSFRVVFSAIVLKHSSARTVSLHSCSCKDPMSCSVFSPSFLEHLRICSAFHAQILTPGFKLFVTFLVHSSRNSRGFAMFSAFILKSPDYTVFFSALFLKIPDFRCHLRLCDNSIYGHSKTAKNNNKIAQVPDKSSPLIFVIRFSKLVVTIRALPRKIIHQKFAHATFSEWRVLGIPTVVSPFQNWLPWSNGISWQCKVSKAN